jgi:hypothetical protein
MTQQIGIDPVDLEDLVQQAIEGNRAFYDKLNPEQQIEFRKNAVGLIEYMGRCLEEERRKTLDQVLRIMDVVDRIEKSPMLRAAIIKFRDEA